MRIGDIGCLVTGASRGIGAAVAVELARRRCRVGLVARSEADLAAVAERCRQAGGEAACFAADVTDAAAVAAAADAASAWAGNLRLAVVNAGVGTHGSALSADMDVRLPLDVNYVGAVNTIRAAAVHLESASPAAVVAVSSLAGLIPLRGGGAYGASKAALIAYLRCLRLELAGSGVRVAWVCPGAVDTEMIVEGVPHGKLPRLARLLVPVLSPERVARAVVRAAAGGRPQRVVPVQGAFFASFMRHAPRLAELVERVTGAGDV